MIEVRCTCGHLLARVDYQHGIDIARVEIKCRCGRIVNVSQLVVAPKPVTVL